MQQDAQDKSNYVNDNKLVDLKFGGVWDQKDIVNIFNVDEVKETLKSMDKNIAQKYLNKICTTFNINTPLTSGEIDDFENSSTTKISQEFIEEYENSSITKISKKAVGKYLKNIIKNNILSNASLEDNLNYLKDNVSTQNEKLVWDSILEWCIDKCINDNLKSKGINIDLQQIFESSSPSGEILFIMQKLMPGILELIHNKLVSIQNNETKSGNGKIIYNYIIDKLTNTFANHFVVHYGFDEAMNKYGKQNPNYIKKYLLPGIFENNIIQNNIFPYTLSANDMFRKYNNKDLQNMWEQYIKDILIAQFSVCIKYQSINNILKQFTDTSVKNYVSGIYKEFLGKKIKNDIESNKTLKNILLQYEDEETKSFVRSIYNELISNYNKIKSE